MSAAKFTPGPWRVVPKRRDDAMMIVNPDDTVIVCDITASIKDEGAAADAALIAAAPDMYAALAAIVAAHEECDTMGIGYVLADAARTALAKARGES